MKTGKKERKKEIGIKMDLITEVALVCSSGVFNPFGKNMSKEFPLTDFFMPKIFYCIIGELIITVGQIHTPSIFSRLKEMVIFRDQEIRQSCTAVPLIEYD